MLKKFCLRGAVTHHTFVLSAFSVIAVMSTLFAPAASQAGSYCGAAGTAGSSAIHYTDPSFIDWATGCEVTRGYQSIAAKTAYATYGTASDAIGTADNAIVSLGDAGSAVLTFDKAVTNGLGYDFAVFENSFSSTFLELAFVEVSSDGTNYFRFDAVSETPTTTQVGSFGNVDPTCLNNLAGKYQAYYGTPFDLGELAGKSPLLDVNSVTHVRIVDAVGSITSDYCTYDSRGNIVNDPWPTAFASGGFDLDAVGVIHQVPEPGMIALIGCFLVFVAVWKYWRRSRRKNYAAVVLCSFGLLLIADQITATADAETVTFEDLTVPSDGYWRGPALNGVDEEIVDETYGYSSTICTGSFTSGGVQFVNRYNKSWGSWGGFGYSNRTDTTTAGSSNQYSAFPGSGCDASRNYAIAYGYSNEVDRSNANQLQQLPYVVLPNGLNIQSISVTNTTYAALSMQNGDSFAKRFGYTYQYVNGVKTLVSSNDPDWFKLTVYGSDALGNVLSNNVEFYLADYRSSDSASDYIINDWQELDLTSLSDAECLYFNLSSSDTGDFGMNTPGYFALDNVSYTAIPEPSAIAMLTAAATIWVYRLRKRRRNG